VEIALTKERILSENNPNTLQKSYRFGELRYWHPVHKFLYWEHGAWVSWAQCNPSWRERLVKEHNIVGAINMAGAATLT
jgi:hypothetical protein